MAQTSTNDLATPYEGLQVITTTFVDDGATTFLTGPSHGVSVGHAGVGEYVLTVAQPFRRATATATLDYSAFDFSGGPPDAADLGVVTSVADRTVTVLVYTPGAPLVAADLAAGQGVSVVIVLDTSSAGLNG